MQRRVLRVAHRVSSTRNACGIFCPVGTSSWFVCSTWPYLIFSYEWIYDYDGHSPPSDLLVSHTRCLLQWARTGVPRSTGTTNQNMPSREGSFNLEKQPDRTRSGTGHISGIARSSVAGTGTWLTLHSTVLVLAAVCLCSWEHLFSLTARCTRDR